MMMRISPFVSEVLIGLSRPGKAHYDHLALVLLQVAVLFVFWPKGGIEELLASEHSPYTLAGVVIAMGLAMAYVALRMGDEKILLPGQRGLRGWTLGTSLGIGRIVYGYAMAQLVHSLYLLLLSAPLLLMAFTVSGGEWAALGWCSAAAIVQALFYRLCGAIVHLTVGLPGNESSFAIRTIFTVGYLLVGWIAPVTSHPALAFRLLGENTASPMPLAATPLEVTFFAIYGGSAIVAALVIHRLLARLRRRSTVPAGDARVGEAAT